MPQELTQQAKSYHWDRKARLQALLNLITVISVLGDLLFFEMGMILAFYGRRGLSHYFGSDLQEFHLPLLHYVGHFVFGGILFLGLAGRKELYSASNILKLRQTFISIMNVAVLWGMIYLFLSLLFSFHPLISRLYVLLSMILGLALIIHWRWLLRWFLEISDVAILLRQRVVIVGWNIEVDNLAKAIIKDAFHPYDIIGCLPSANNVYRMAPPKNIRKLGDYQEIEEIHKNEMIDIVLVGDLDPNTREIIALCEFCQREMIQFKVVPTYFQILISGLHLETITGVPILGIARLPLDSILFRFIKRMMDIVGAIIGLILAVPLIIVFGFIVYLESPGSIIYRQNRMGRRGQIFEMYKIRSMMLNAEKDGAQWARPNDSRRLKIGAFLRKWNIDEVPQFWNVLKGDMSLVGPRPERPELIKDFKDQIRYYNARHNAKPGMTGWAQIHGLRGQTDLNDRLRYDLYYLENWTPVLDLYIMLFTLIKNENAY